MRKPLELDMRIASANLMELPRHDDTVDEAIDVATGPVIDIVGWQEASNDVYRAKLEKLKLYKTVFAGRTIFFNAPTSHHHKKWRVLSSGSEMIFDGVKGIAYTRHLEWVELQLLDDPSVHVFHINLHAPVVKADRRDLRLAMRKRTKKVLDKVVARAMACGLPIIITGDLNDSSRWFPVRLVSTVARRTFTVANRIDQITFINGAKTRWEVKRKSTRKSTSDHDVLVADVVLKEK